MVGPTKNFPICCFGNFKTTKKKKKIEKGKRKKKREKYMSIMSYAVNLWKRLAKTMQVSLKFPAPRFLS